MSQELFDALREECSEIKKLKEAKTQVAAAEKKLDQQIELRTLKIHTLMKAQNLEKQHFPEIGLFTIGNRKSPRIIERDVFVKYLQSVGDEGIMSVLPATLAAYVKKDLPSDVDPEKIGLTVFEKPTVAVRKA